MTATTDICNQLHPRVTVVPADASVRAVLRSALEDAARVIDQDALDERISVVVRRRTAADAARIADLEGELAALEARHRELAADHAAIDDDHAGLVDAVEWCLRQPVELPAARDRESAALVDVEERARESRAANRDLNRVLEQRAAAEAALEEARHQLSQRRASGTGTEDAEELRRQVEAVEGRLREAEASARQTSEETTLQLSRAELALERIRHDARSRRARAEELLRRLPEGALPPVDDDVLAHAEALGGAVRVLADQRLPDLERARSALDDAAAELERRHADLERRRARLGVAVAGDDAEALESLLAEPGPAVVVLDDVLGERCDPHQARRSVVASADGPPVLVMTDAVDVLAWAIDLPAGEALVTSAAGLLLTAEHFDLIPDEDLAPAMETTP